MNDMSRRWSSHNVQVSTANIQNSCVDFPSITCVIPDLQENTFELDMRPKRHGESLFALGSILSTVTCLLLLQFLKQWCIITITWSGSSLVAPLYCFGVNLITHSERERSQAHMECMRQTMKCHTVKYCCFTKLWKAETLALLTVEI